MFERYVLAQEKKAEATVKAVELRDWHQSLEERKQRLKEMKYEDKILKMNIADMCLEDQAWYGPIQEEIRSRYRENSSSSDIDLNLDWLLSLFSEMFSDLWYSKFIVFNFDLLLSVCCSRVTMEVLQTFSFV